MRLFIKFVKCGVVIESRGLNPFAGFIHQDKENHPTLASDMMEEWRAIFVDSIVMSLIQGHEISIEKFHYDEETGACFLDKEGMRIFLSKFERNCIVRHNIFVRLKEE